MSLPAKARHEFIGRLRKAVPAETAGAKAGRPDTGDPRLLAILRRSLAYPPGEDLRAVAELEDKLPETRDERTRRLCYLVAGLFALHRRHADNVDLGQGFRELENKSNASAAAGLKRRLTALVDADDAQLPERLRQAIHLLHQREVGIDFTFLLGDLLDWNQPERKVQRRWLRHYLRPTEPSPPATADNAA